MEHTVEGAHGSWHVPFATPQDASCPPAVGSVQAHVYRAQSSALTQGSPISPPVSGPTHSVPPAPAELPPEPASPPPPADVDVAAAGCESTASPEHAIIHVANIVTSQVEGTGVGRRLCNPGFMTRGYRAIVPSAADIPALDDLSAP